MDFSARLKELRCDGDMTQTELAEKVNLRTSAISKYEKSITQPSLDTLVLFAELFNVSVDYLLGISDLKKSLRTFFCYAIRNENAEKYKETKCRKQNKN